jgi:hypothetical protein
MTTDELKTEIASARSRGIPDSHLAAVAPHYAKLYPGDVHAIAGALVQHFPNAGEGDASLAVNAEHMVDRLNRPAPPAPQNPLCDWPARPVLPVQPSAFTRAEHDPPSIPARVARYAEAQQDMNQAGWGAWGLERKRS